jgi:hypothetical protein
MGYGADTPGAGGRRTILGQGPGRTRRLVRRTLNVDTVLSGAGGLLMGWNMRESTGAAGAVVELYDGHDTGGELTGTVGNASGVSSWYWAYPDGIEITSGLFAHVVTGSMDVIVFFRADIPDT